MKLWSRLFAVLLAGASLGSLATDKVIVRDVQPAGGAAAGVRMVLHDNGDGTFSEQVFTTGSGGGGGGDASAANQLTQISQMPASLGAKAGAGSLSVVPNTDTPFPVTGTFWQAVQPVSGTFWQATQPVSAAALPLPTGAATSAKQPALGTAGTASTDVLSVQGISGMTALKVDGSAVTQPVSGTFWQSTQPVSIAAMTSTAAGDTNRLPVSEPDTLVLTPSSVTSAATIFTQDMTGYRSISVHVTSAGSGCTITYETSDDNTNWLSASGLISSATATGAVTTTTAAQVTTFPRRGKYFRARVSTYGSGTVTVVATLSTAPATTLGGALNVSGLVAHGSAIGGNPVRIGGRALTSNYTAVTTGQVADFVTTTVGAMVTRPYSIPEQEWSYAAASGGISNTTTAVTIAAAAGAGIRNYITGVQITSDALGTATELAIRDGAAGTVIWRHKIGTAGLPAGWGITFPIPLKSSANTLLEVVTLTASVTGAVYFDAQGYTAP